jgi:hypothetical protein
MNILLVLLGIICGTTIAYILNKFFASRIEDKNHRIGLKTTSYIVCIILGIVFAAIDSLQTILNIFIEDRIQFIEIELAEVFPNSNILELSIDANGLTSVIEELQQMVNDIDTSSDDYFESFIFDTFLNKLTSYVYAAENGINTIVMMGDENGLITIKSILYNLKDIALKTISPYFVFGQIGVLILLLIYIGIYAGIVVFLKKGGAMYNKSIVFEDINYKRRIKRPYCQDEGEILGRGTDYTNETLSLIM